jgi:large subunit ribosomal protein L17
MRHRYTGRQLSRTTSHRVALRRNMASSLIQHGAIRTTEPKAKELRRFVERIITIARQNTLHARRQVIALLQDRAMADNEGTIQDKSVVQKLFDEVAPRYVNRPGGYTRIIRLAERRIGDAGSQVMLQLVEDKAASPDGEAATPTGRRRRRAAKRAEMAQAAGTQPKADQGEQPADEAPKADDGEKK